MIVTYISIDRAARSAYCQIMETTGNNAMTNVNAIKLDGSIETVRNHVDTIAHIMGGAYRHNNKNAKCRTLKWGNTYRYNVAGWERVIQWAIENDVPTFEKRGGSVYARRYKPYSWIT